MSDPQRKRSRYVDAETWAAKTAKTRKRRQEGPEGKDLSWDSDAVGRRENVGASGRRAVIVSCCLASILLLGGVVYIMSDGGADESDVTKVKKVVDVDSVRMEKFVSEGARVVENFLDEPDPEERLKYVRDAEGVRKRMADYSGEVLTSPAVGVVPMGLREWGETPVSRNMVRLEGGKRRVLSVVDTEEGPKVDWDAYARYGTASWEELREGGIDKAEMRVVVSEGTYFNPPFDDSKKWRCYRMDSPDLDGWLYVYAGRGGVEDLKIQKWLGKDPEAESGAEKEKIPEKLALMDWPTTNEGMGDLKIVEEKRSVRRPVILRIKRHENRFNEVLFELEEAVARGWVK